MDDTQFLTLDDASRLAGTPKPTLRFWIRCGHIRGYRPGRRVLVDREELLAFVRAAEVGPENSTNANRRARQSATAQKGPDDDGADLLPPR